MQLCDRRVFYAHRGGVLNTEELDDFINTLQKFGKTSTQIVFPLLLSTEACLYIQVLMHKMI